MTAPYITLTEAAAALGVHENTVRNRYRHHLTTRLVEGRRRTVVPISSLSREIADVDDPRIEMLREDLGELKSSHISLVHVVGDMKRRLRKLEGGT